MRFRLVRVLAAEGFPVAVTCRVLKVSTSGFYEWSGRRPAARDVDDAVLLDQIIDIHAAARAELANAMFEWIEGWYNPRRRHTALGMLSPHNFETLHTAANTAA